MTTDDATSPTKVYTQFQLEDALAAVDATAGATRRRILS